jgi:cellulose synthase/poly-beta-1,6-N-acetylglucosamine synthase-like glycosyltransferase
MKLSVVMIDGQFREHTYGAEYFSRQDFPAGEFEVIWVEFYSKVPDAVRAQTTVRVITLDNPDDKTYHSSYCFNAGIGAATGELIVIPDADQIVKPDFLGKLYAIHSAYEKLVVYA